MVPKKENKLSFLLLLLFQGNRVLQQICIALKRGKREESTRKKKLNNDFQTKDHSSAENFTLSKDLSF